MRDPRRPEAGGAGAAGDRAKEQVLEKGVSAANVPEPAGRVSARALESAAHAAAEVAKDKRHNIV